MATVFAKESGMRLHDGVPVHFTRDEAWDAASPFVKAYPQLFAPRPTRVRDVQSGRVERATARPGESR